MPNILNPHGHIDAGATECADWQELWCARGSFRKWSEDAARED